MDLSLSCLWMVLLCVVDDVGEWTKEDSSMDYIHCKALHGFVIILSADGVIVFVNENVKKYLGVQQVSEVYQVCLISSVYPGHWDVFTVCSLLFTYLFDKFADTTCSIVVYCQCWVVSAGLREAMLTPS